MNYDILFSTLPKTEKDGETFAVDEINYPLRERVEVIIEGKYPATVKSFCRFEVNKETLEKIKSDLTLKIERVEPQHPGSAVFSDSSGGLKHVGNGVYVSF